MSNQKNVDEWKEYDLITRKIKDKGLEIQNRMISLIQEWNEFDSLLRKAYMAMPKKECLLLDSPLSPHRMLMVFRKHMLKMGWKWASPLDLSFGTVDIKNFADVVSDSCLWGARISRDDARAAKKELMESHVEKAKADLKRV